MTNSGTGPGAITPDGSPVELYKLLKPGAEPEIIAQVTPPGGSILEIGCGVGRLTHALLDRGYTVVGVDESADMLAQVRGAETVRSRAQDLWLGRRFDLVLLASHLVQTADDAARADLLAACARHVAQGGGVLIQWVPPDGHDRWRPGPVRTDGELTVAVAAVERVSPAIYAVTMRYTYGDRVWTQSFVSRRLSGEELTAALAAAGLRLARFVTDDRAWVLAEPAEKAAFTK